MAKSNVVELSGRDTIDDPLTESLRTGAEQLIYQAVDAELRELLVAHSRRGLVDGRAGVVRNGYLPARELQTGLGPVTVRIPKVRAQTGEPVTFHSALVPDKNPGGGTAMAVFEGDLEWRDGSGSGGSGRGAGEGSVGEHGVAPEAGMGTRVPELERRTIG